MMLYNRDNQHYDYYDFREQPIKGRLSRVIQFESMEAVQAESTSQGISSHIYYDIYGNVRQTRDGDNKPTYTYFDPTYRLYPIQIRNANGHSEHFRYFHLRFRNGNGAWQVNTDGKPGLLRGHQQLNGLWLYYFYDSRGRLTREFQGWHEQAHPSNNSVAYIWDRPNVAYRYVDAAVRSDGRLSKLPLTITWTKTQDHAKQWSNGGTWAHELYNGFGQAVQTQTPHTDWSVAGNGAAGQRIISDATYDGLGQVVAQSRPYLVAADSDRRDDNLYLSPQTQPHSEMKYDAGGRVVWQRHLTNYVTTTIYGNRSVYVRDGRGYVASASYFDAVGQLKAVDEAVATFNDPFGSSEFDSSWGERGNVQATNHVARITGDGSWSNHLSNNLPTSGDQGVQFSFRATSNANGTFYLKRGEWKKDSYHRWGLRIVGNTLYSDQYEAGAYKSAQELMTFTAGQRYNVVMRAAQDSSDDFVLVVWEGGNPEKRAEIRLAEPDKPGWHQTDWRFYAQLHTGQVDFDNYKELTVSRTRYRYDVQGNLTKVINAFGHETTMEYDWLGRKTRMSDPDMGEWQYAYDKRGNLVSQTDAKNQTIAFTYDNVNRLTAKRLGSTSGAYLSRFEYDGGHSSSNRSLGARRRMRMTPPRRRRMRITTGQPTRMIRWDEWRPRCVISPARATPRIRSSLAIHRAICLSLCAIRMGKRSRPATITPLACRPTCTAPLSMLRTDSNSTTKPVK